MSYQEMLYKDIESRVARLQQAMKTMHAEACILSTAVNLFYMTGSVYNGYFYLPAEGKPIHFVKRPENISFENTVYIRKPEQITEELQNRGIVLPQHIFLETDVIAYSDCVRLLTTFGLSEAANASSLMRKLRTIKSEFELSQVRACAQKHVAVYKLVPSLYRRGMSDIELQIEIERQMRLHGSHGIFRSYGENMDIYMGSLLAGENAETPSPFDFALGGKGMTPLLPLGASGVEIKQGQTIMVDMAGNYSPWMTDMTRVFSVGKIGELAYKAHQVSLQIQDIIIENARTGIACSDLYNMAMDEVKRNNLEPYFMGTNQQAKFIGHGVGLEINEPPVLTPRSKELLEANMVFALEPKFVIPGIGAVGIENTFVVTETGIEKITLLDEHIIEL